MESYDTTSVKLRLRYQLAQRYNGTRIHRTEETSETASQTSCKVVEDQLGIVSSNLSHIRNVFMRNKGHHFKQSGWTGGQMTDDESMSQPTNKRLRVDLLVRLSDNNQMREFLLASLLAHVDQRELL